MFEGSCSALRFMDVVLKDTPGSQLPVSTLCFKPAVQLSKLHSDPSYGMQLAN